MIFLYPVSCFFYAVAGIIRIYQGGVGDGVNLIIQSFVSYMSDVHTLSRPSAWHFIDRTFAKYTCMYHFYSISDRHNVLLINLLIFSIGYMFLIDSQNKYISGDQNFQHSHIIWHFACIPMALNCANNFLSF